MPRIFPTKGALQEGWRRMQRCQELGLAKSIGVSNFTVNDLLKLEGCGVTPAVNQVRETQLLCLAEN